MTTPTGAISMLDVIEELDGSRTPRPISLNDADVRALAGKPSGAITMDDLRGKSIAPPFDAQNVTKLGLSGSGVSYWGAAPIRVTDFTKDNYNGITWDRITAYVTGDLDKNGARTIFREDKVGMGVSVVYDGYIEDEATGSITHVCDYTFAHAGGETSVTGHYKYDHVSVRGSIS